MTDEDSCAKKTCKNSGACCFGFIYDVITCPFTTLYDCVYHCCKRCCCSCKNRNYSPPPTRV